MNPEDVIELEALHTLPWHTFAEHDVFRKLQATKEGLSDEQVATRQHEFGRNALPAQKLPTPVEIALRQFKSPLIYILLVAGVVSLLIGDRKDALFIFFVVLLNAGIGAFQEWKAEQSVGALQQLLVISARVRRNGTEQLIDSEELVPGDIVRVESGNRVPADLRLLQVNNLAVDESLLTGESLAVAKRTEPAHADAPLSERANMAFAGSTVTSGRGVGIVVATGQHTEVGKIARAVTTSVAAKPPLVIRMERFAQQISVIVLVAVAVIALIEFARGRPYQEVIFIAIALAVSAIPEGLPVALTVALSIGTNRMARRHVIVRKLAAVEGLGSCTYIASDKTGTLTMNQQTVKVVALPSGEHFTVSGEGYAGEGEVAAAPGSTITPAAHARLEELARAAVLCNEARLVYEQGTWQQHGDPIDVALLALGYKMGFDPPRMRHGLHIVSEVPFESERKYAAIAYHEAEAQSTRIRVAVKGAVETVVPLAHTMMTARGMAAVDPRAIEQDALALSENGYRVLAIAGGDMAPDSPPATLAEHDMPPLTFLGLIGLIDPMRPEAKAAVAKCQQAGLTVAMVTGDHPATALAIARELGITTSWDSVVTGQQLTEIGAEETPEFLAVVQSGRVFARVSPLQKLEIVQALLALGHFVAVTGDGVNDAPALRAAHIGVAMGSGTDIAKDTAAIIITNDNFASIEAGVEEGRFAYDNIRKVTYLLISTGAAEILLFALAIFFGLPLPLIAVQLLWLNLVTNGIQGVALAFEGGEPGAMRRPPREPTARLFDPLMIQETAITGAIIGLVAFGLWWWLLRQGTDDVAARNLVLLLMVLFENVHVFNCRSEYLSAFRVPLRRNPLLVIGVIAALGIHVLAMHLPIMQSVLQIAPVPFVGYVYLLLLALTVLVVMEIFKLVRGRMLHRPPAPAPERSAPAA